ncbi:MAG: NADH-quinone oxidoreductase subunit C [Pelosinus sp.]|nr:NADH-quinone oxidoreductase subunit C [Pelosinus sp.]
MSSQILSSEAISKLQAQFPNSISMIGEGCQQALLIEDSKFLTIMGVLKNDAAYQFTMLSNLTAVDYLDHFEVVYHLYSLNLKHTVTIKARCPADKPAIWSVMSIWASANFQEREVYDLLGLEFVGHADLRRILLPEDFEGHPLRKEYKLSAQDERRRVELCLKPRHTP